MDAPPYMERLSSRRPGPKHQKTNTTEMTFELAKQLLICGYPMTVSAPGMNGCMQLHTGLWYAIPTLSELIEGCGEDFKCLRNFRREIWAAHGRTEGERQYQESWPGGNDWVSEAVSTYSTDEGTTSPISANASTPEEAVAKLWLALNNK
jgi:hypothetical protein